MACDTPVIAFRSGSVPEVIDDGVTGFVVESEEESVEAVRHRLPARPPQDAQDSSSVSPRDEWLLITSDITSNWWRTGREWIPAGAVI